MQNKRQFARTKFDSRVEVVHPVMGTSIFRTGDVSDGGIFLHAGGFAMNVGDVVTVQVQDVPVDVPVVRMRVVRASPEGYGLSYED
jgi:hypothetical protein